MGSCAAPVLFFCASTNIHKTAIHYYSAVLEARQWRCPSCFAVLGLSSIPSLATLAKGVCQGEREGRAVCGCRGGLRSVGAAAGRPSPPLAKIIPTSHDSAPPSGSRLGVGRRHGPPPPTARTAGRGCGGGPRAAAPSPAPPAAPPFRLWRGWGAGGVWGGCGGGGPDATSAESPRDAVAPACGAAQRPGPKI